MNMLGESDRCRICGFRFSPAYAAATSDEQRRDLVRQILAGACFACQRERQSAAFRFIHAADRVRLINALAQDATPAVPNGYVEAVRTAADDGVRLKLWPSPRRSYYRRPERFRGDGDDRE